MSTQLQLAAMKVMTSRYLMLSIPILFALMGVAGPATGGIHLFGNPFCGGGSGCGGA